MEPPQQTNWSQSRFFRWMIRLGAVKGTVVATAGIDALSLVFALITMAALHRLSWMGVFISGSLPLLLVPLHWYPFMRIAEQLNAAESRVRKSERRYRAILEKMSEAYAEIDQYGRLTFFNDSLCRITGHRREDLELQRIAEYLAPADIRRLIRGALRIKNGEDIGSAFDLAVATQRGVRYLDASFSLLRNDQNEWCGYHAVLFDVTEKLATNREKLALEQHLLRAKRMESLGMLAGGVAHDLNNILCGIVGYPDLLLLECGDNEPLRSSLLAMKQSGEKAAAVVQDLLTLSRRGMVVSEVVNLNDVVTDYLGSPECAQLVESSPGIKLEQSLDPELLNIEGSRLHLFKMVMNLVLNSFEAIVPPGKVCLTTSNRHLEQPVKGYETVRPGKYVTLTVQDSGVGITPEDAERIFEPFYSRKVLGRSGSGLGLAVVWGAVRDHKGHIIVDSEPGEGTSIGLFFPPTGRELPQRPAPTEVKSFLGHAEHVLAVDDMREQRDLMSRILIRMGYQVHVAASGEEALGYLRGGGAADVVILDMIMSPGMDGLDAYRGIRDLRPGLPAIITSGFSETDRVREALRLGAGPYVKKPYRVEDLARVIHRVLGK